MEIWKPVPSLRGLYEVSDQGRIRRVSVQTKLSAEDMQQVRLLREQGRTYTSIALEFGVTQRAIISALIPRRFSFRTPDRILKTPNASVTGYPVIRVSIDGIPRTYRMHRLIAEAFLGPVPDGMEINHKNGTRDDNRIENLEIVDRAQNMIHSVYVLRKQPKGLRGSANSRSVLVESDIPVIRTRYAKGGESMASIGKDYGVTATVICRIMKGKIWTHA